MGLKSHSICLLDGEQGLVKRYSVNNDMEGFRKLEADLDMKTRICLEPTGTYSINIFLFLKRKGHDIRFCKTDSAHDFREAMFRSKKHDRLDALALAKYRIVNESQTFDGSKILERLGADSEFHDGHYQELATLVDQYLSAKRQMQALKTQIIALVDLRFPEAIQIFQHKRGCKTIRKALLHSREEILSGHIKLDRAKDIQEKLENSIGQYDMKRAEFQTSVAKLEELETKVKELEKGMKAKLDEMGYAFLFSYFCLNTAGIAVLVKEIKDIRRFYRYSQNGAFNKKNSLKAFKKFLGIAVSSNQSGGRAGGHKLTKSGNMTLRNKLFMMAIRYVQVDPLKYADRKEEDLDPVKFKLLYEKRVAGGTKKLVALTKVMNKIATDLFFIFKQNADDNVMAQA